MAKELFYRQCRLQKKSGTAVCEQVSYIPEPYCVVGKTLKLRNEEGDWDDGWVVVSVGDRQPAAQVEANGRDYLKTRKGSDITGRPPPE
jgi:hypothetical protein